MADFSDQQLLEVFEKHYLVPTDDDFYDRASLTRGLREVERLRASDEQTVERLAAYLYSLDPFWSFARGENVPWDDPDPAWIAKWKWREQARAILEVVFSADPSAPLATGVEDAR